MANVETRTISLSSDQAAYIDSKVRAGDYATASEVIRAGLQALKERDQAIDRWLQEQVASSFDAMMADPARAVAAEDALASVRARHAKP